MTSKQSQLQMSELDQLSLANSIFIPQETVYSKVSGLMDPTIIEELSDALADLSGIEYQENVLTPTKNPKRLSAKKAALNISKEVLEDHSSGALFAMEVVIKISHLQSIKVALIGHDREYMSGSWSAKEHQKATELVRLFESKDLPIVTFIDTPGAAANEEANSNLQAKAISELIATMMALTVPSIGIIWGLAYSGGAIPLAATNLLFATKSSLFSTIQPEGLANIARKQKLTWQNCAQIVSVSAPESYRKGWIDGILNVDIDERPNELSELANSIFQGINLIEEKAAEALKFGAAENTTQSWLAWTNKLIKQSSSNIYNLGVHEHPLQGVVASLPNPNRYATRYIRQQHLRSRFTYSPLSELENRSLPILQKDSVELTQTSDNVLVRWQNNPEKIEYLSTLKQAYDRFLKTHAQRQEKRGAISTLLLGDNQENYVSARRDLALELGFYAYAKWKRVCPDCLDQFGTYLKSRSQHDLSISLENIRNKAGITTYDLLHLSDLHQELSFVIHRLNTFDELYDGLISNLRLVAKEANNKQQIDKESMQNLLQAALNLEDQEHGDGRTEFWDDLLELTQRKDISLFLNQVADIKQQQNPRIAESLFVLINYFIETLIPKYLLARDSKQSYDGRIVPTKIGRRKDFWHRLFVAQCDLQILELQNLAKARNPSWESWLNQIFCDYETFNDQWVSDDNCNFPGFKESVERHARSSIPAGMITGIGTEKTSNQKVGFIVSNTSFQAGAMDTASACKIMDLLNQCQQLNLPVIGIISSGGMQTKEGASSLFGMATINEAINTFCQSTSLPVVMIGYGDCTGGVQASFMTHPLVQTWYISGSNIPFAGQLVVPSYLPSTCTLANYLSNKPGLMKGLIKHPFEAQLDEEFSKIDPAIPMGHYSLSEVVSKALSGLNARSISQYKESEIDKKYSPIQRVLVHARGCTAAKVVKDIKETGRNVVLLQSDPDMDSFSASMLDTNDELICIGGNTPEESYLNANSVLRLAHIWEVDAIHPGIGFLSENPDFAQACQLQKLNFIGPDYRSIAAMGNKSAAIQCAIEAGVPVVPGSYKSIESEEELLRHANAIGFPILLKAAFGGGGKGIERLDNSENLCEAFRRLSLEAFGAFGRGDLYLEKFVESIRHIEVQVARDKFGNTQLLGLRDCSVQRDNQKIIEESGSQALGKDLKEKAFDYARLLANHIDYVGIGTVEFIYNITEDCLYFMEMNTRLQVEHPVTEAITGVDLVKLQLEIAEGQDIRDLNWQERGHALEVRINAERVELKDGRLVMLSSPGTVDWLNYPSEPWVKVIQSVSEGHEITPYYDSLVMQVIIAGNDRIDSISKMLNFLDLLEIDGINTNISLIQSILKDRLFVSGEYSTRFLESFPDRLHSSQLTRSLIKTDVGKSDISIEHSKELKVFAPASGVVYSASNPGEKPYANEGDIIEIQQTLCLIESMKMYRTFCLEQHNSEANCLYPKDNKYQIQKIFASDGQQVSEGDLLFVIEPMTT